MTTKKGTYLLEAIRDTTAVEVVYGKLNRNLVARKDLDVVHTHLPGNVRQDFVAVLEFHLEHRIRQCFFYRTLEFDDILFRQKCSSKQIVIKQQL